jgi:hypothetical protein
VQVLGAALGEGVMGALDVTFTNVCTMGNLDWLEATCSMRLGVQ